MIKYLTMTIGKQKNIALIAHDGKKQDMLKWCMDNKEILRQHNLSGTGTTARMIADHVGLKIKGYNSGPLGGRSADRGKNCRGKYRHGYFLLRSTGSTAT